MNEFPVSVAIIDDDNLYRKILAKMFQRAGMYVMFQAENGSLGIEQMKNCLSLPKVVIIDVEMPVMDGFETARLVKMSWPQVGIIAHSSLKDQEVRDLMIKSGADFFIAKEAGLVALVSAVEKLAVLKYYHTGA